MSEQELQEVAARWRATITTGFANNYHWIRAKAPEGWSWCDTGTATLYQEWQHYAKMDMAEHAREALVARMEEGCSRNPFREAGQP